MVISNCRTAIRTDRGLSAAHGGTLLASRARTVATKLSLPVMTQVSFVGVPAYTVDQESHPPRGT